MVTVKEREFSGQIKAALESAGCWVFNVHGHRMQKAGVPDLYVASRLWTGWIELKIGDGKPSLMQVMQMKDLLRRNVPAFVVRLRDGVVYCELWTGEAEFETLSYCEQWDRLKGQARGLSLLEMFDQAGRLAVNMILMAMKGVD